MDNIAAKELDYGFAMSVKALIEAMAMQAENQKRAVRGEAPAYGEDEFLEVIKENGLYHNAVLTRWEGK